MSQQESQVSKSSILVDQIRFVLSLLRFKNRFQNIELKSVVMPPKSAKKDAKSVWHNCDKCGVKVHQTKLKLHENQCENSKEDSLGLFEGKFNTSSLNRSLPSEIDSKDAPSSYLERFVFIPESICTICNFTMGSKILIEIKNQKVVRSSWTISDKYLDEVFTSSQGKSQ